MALGIHDITLESHLGEPLVAKIMVTDVEKSPDLSCFNITDTSHITAFKKASLFLNTNNNQYQLTIKTYSPITEPIVNLRVSYHCEPQLIREYTLLLDPPSQLPLKSMPDDNPGNIAIESSEDLSQGMTSLAKSEVNRSPAIKASEIRPSLNKPPAKKKSKRTNKSTIDHQLMDAYVGKPEGHDTLTKQNIAGANQTDQTQQHQDTSRPFLKISSGTLNSDTLGNIPPLALRLETKIDFSRTEPTTILTNDEVMDEVTVMANRLAHLEKQIVSLQLKNTQLVDEAGLAKKALAEQKSTWLKNLLLSIGVIVMLIIANWLRRTIINRRLNQQEANWFGAPKTPESSVFTNDEISAPKDGEASDPYFDDILYPQHTSLDSTITEGMSLTEDASINHEYILENADVFIEHGRPSLAIQLLQNHLSDFPTESPKIWLKLLSLIASEGSQGDYDKVAAECKHFFNIKMPDFANANAEDTSSIEDFPHIISKLEGIWGSQYTLEFLNDLIYNQQSQPREGFGRGTFDELFFLKQIAETLNKQSAVEQKPAEKVIASKPNPEMAMFNAASLSDSVANVSNNVKFNHENPPQQKEDFYPTLEQSAFQGIPAYEVDMLKDFDDAPDIDFNPPLSDDRNISTNETSNTSSAENLNKETILANEIEFDSSLPLLPDQENIDDDTRIKDKIGTTKVSNVIEWDLPDKD